MANKLMAAGDRDGPPQCYMFHKVTNPDIDAAEECSERHIEGGGAIVSGNTPMAASSPPWTKPGGVCRYMIVAVECDRLSRWSSARRRWECLVEECGGRGGCEESWEAGAGVFIPEWAPYFGVRELGTRQPLRRTKGPLFGRRAMWAVFG